MDIETLRSCELLKQAAVYMKSNNCLVFPTSRNKVVFLRYSLAKKHFYRELHYLQLHKIITMIVPGRYKLNDEYHHLLRETQKMTTQNIESEEHQLKLAPTAPPAPPAPPAPTAPAPALLDAIANIQEIKEHAVSLMQILWKSLSNSARNKFILSVLSGHSHDLNYILITAIAKAGLHSCTPED